MDHLDHSMNHTTNDAAISAAVMNHSGHIHHGHSFTSHMHSMSFHFGFHETILFSSWIVTSPAGIITTCSLTVLICFIMESIRWFRNTRPVYDVDLHTEQSSVATVKFTSRITVAMCVDAILHAIQLTLCYILMLLFMTFNVWICAATVLGEVFSRLIFFVLFGENRVMKGSRANVGCCG
ncbi:unnamed protein product [Litomosoides sigmodontis]|uniref:Copper transport protein n=1 Tax=Litomosoides sigmodontis TaxID=42156 RepID=A0A3P6RV82_LITSI|nr:unnamed protein product [Litomosoides sigmodontis]